MNMISALKIAFTYGNIWHKILVVVATCIQLAGFAAIVYGSFCVGIYLATH